MKKVVVTGCTGFIGGSLTRRLLADNIFVYGIDYNLDKMKEFESYPNFKAIIAEFAHYKDIPTMITDKDIDVFFHFAWAGGFTTAIRDYTLQMSNAAYAGDALVAAHAIGSKKFVYSGTYNEFEIQTFLNTKEFEPRYTCIYSTGKTAADLICRTLAYNLGIDYCVGFIPMPYGENNYSKQLANVVIDCLLRKVSPKLVEGKNTYDMVYIGDIVGAFVSIGEKGKNNGQYYIGHRQLKSFREWIIDIRDILAPEVDLKFGEYKDNQNIDYSLIDLDALYNDTGFECKADFKESILSTADWLKSKDFMK